MRDYVIGTSRAKKLEDAVFIDSSARREIVSWLSTITSYVTAPSTVIPRSERSADGFGVDAEILGRVSLGSADSARSLARALFAIISGGSPDIFAC